ncbi:MAG: hypothetical protein ABSC21_22245 [Terriglobia bacterium]
MFTYIEPMDRGRCACAFPTALLCDSDIFEPVIASIVYDDNFRRDFVTWFYFSYGGWVFNFVGHGHCSHETWNFVVLDVDLIRGYILRDHLTPQVVSFVLMLLECLAL